MREFFDFAHGTRHLTAGVPSSPDAEPPRDIPQASPGQRYSLAPDELVADRYRILRFIGRGGMGEVYEARDEFLHETVALKTLRAALAESDDTMRRFHKEIRLARKVTHPNVCRVFEAGVRERSSTGPALPYFTMDLLPGETLSARIRRTGGLSRAEAFRIAVQIAEGLDAAHQAGIVHADLKSGNVLLVPGPRGERAVITDFGLASIDPSAAPDDTRTMPADRPLAGTLAYMSPEQMTGGPVTAASDIYSFGVVLFEMATGTLPFDPRRPIQGVAQRLSGEGPSARLDPKLDTRWQAGIRRCLEADPARRFATAAELADWFRDTPWPAPRRVTRREWALAAFLAVATLAAAGGLWIWAHRPYRPQPAALAWYRKGVDAMHSMTYEAARKAFEQAVAADPRFALARAGLAQSYEELDFSDRAKESMLRAVALAQETRLPARDARRLLALQDVVAHDYDRAAPLFARLERDAVPAERAAAALESGWLAQQREDTNGAAAAYERALGIDPGYAAARLRLGYILGRRRDVPAALAAFRQAEDLYRAASDYEGVTETLLQQAMLLNRSSRSGEAIPILDRALSAAATVGNPYQQIRLQLQQGVAVRNLGDSAKAESLARQAIDTAIAQKMDNVATGALIDLGNVFLAAGDLSSAGPVFQRALDLATRGGTGRSKARAQGSLASLYEQQNRPKEAKQLLEACLPFYRQAGYRREFVSAMTMLGGAQAELGEFDDSSRTLHSALESALQIQDSRSEAIIRQRLAIVLRDQGAWPQALAECERAKGVSGLVGGAELYWLLGRRQDAEKAIREVVPLLEKNPNRQKLSDLRILQARMAYGAGRMSDALKYAHQASAAVPPGAPQSIQARLIESLVAIRRPAESNAPPGADIVEQFDKEGLAREAASARLAIAEALAIADRADPTARDSASRLALQTLDFYEPRRIWEPAWRAHCILALVSAGSVQAESHRTAARAALSQLRALWPGDAVDTYLERPEIRLLVDNVKL
jgi:tetratricopeptide (TPR) repeat protein